MRIIFMGTPDFAVPSLDMLIHEKYNIVNVITQPDKPKGRGQKTCHPPIKELAIKNGIEVMQPNSVKTLEFINTIREINPDLLITAAYGKILPKDLLDIPKYGCINVHASLLPKYRGAAPINWAIINGEEYTGITTMYTDVGMDTGDILRAAKVKITEDMTSRELHDILSVLGANVLKDTLRDLTTGTLTRTKQNNNESTHAPMLKKEMGHINWSLSSREIHNLVRGINPWPGAYSFYKGEKIKIWKTQQVDGNGNDKPGTIIKVDNNGILISTGDGLINIQEIQFECCRSMCVADYICGHKMECGEILG